MAIGRNPHRFAFARSSSPIPTSERRAARRLPCSSSCAPPNPTFSTSSATSSTAGSSSGAGTGTSFTTTSCKRSCARCARAPRGLRTRQSRRGRPPLRRRRLRRHRHSRRGGAHHADGRRLLVTHGDRFDGVITCAKWLALLGDQLYTMILTLNQHFNALRARLGLPYWSLSQFLKLRVKNAVATSRPSRMRSRARRARAASTASFAVTSITPRCAPSATSCTATRRLGGEPDRAGRSGRRHVVDPALAGGRAMQRRLTMPPAAARSIIEPA